MIIKAKLDAIKGIKKTLNKRKYIQENSSISIGAVWKMMDKNLLPTVIRRY